jgi:hypothetical protein
MESQLLKELKSTLPKGMTIPEPIRLLYEWIEENKFYKDDGKRLGWLYPISEKKQIGTDVTFYATYNSYFKRFDALNSEKVSERICEFAQVGGDGSMAALWLNNEGKTVIVHIGSGSGSTLNCVLAEDAVDFLRLLAIGYDEICWDEDYKFTPSELKPDLKPNIAFQNWVKSTFNTSIPQRAIEIVKNPPRIDDEKSDDSFWNWYSSIKF